MKLLKNEYVLLAIILLLACVTRIYDIQNLPGGLHQDEAFVALNAYDLLAEGRDSGGYSWPVYMSSWGDGQSAMYIWLLLPILLFSQNTVNIFLIRMPQLIVSLLSIAAVFSLIKTLFNDSKKGLLAAFLLAICPWHFMMSRWGLDANLAPGFLIFAALFFAKGTEKPKYLMLSSLFYGLTLYCYALSWPIVPLIVLSEVVLSLIFKKIKFDKYLILSGIILAAVGTPIFLYFLVNQGYIGEINLPFMTIYKSVHYRGGEIAKSFGEIVTNLKTLAKLLILGNTGTVWDTIKPFGLFYPIGLCFAFLGGIAFVFEIIRNIQKKKSSFADILLFIQLFGGLVLGMLITPKHHQTNLLFIPFVLFEAYGIWHVRDLITFFSKYFAEKKSAVASGDNKISGAANDGDNSKMANFGSGFIILTLLTYCVFFVCFMVSYFGSYRPLANAYFGDGIGESIEYALEAAEANNLHILTAERAVQWPRLLLYTHTLPSRYFSENLEYEYAPTPKSFTKDDLLIRNGIDYDAISPDSVYIIYFTDREIFEKDFDLVAFSDWYVAVPKFQAR